ncbi:uncharacterized protein METZ01_LOCUS472186 [marine metagenome]|uniref:Uncharacterized protein n=1 Tax=marine metagenome TaxID=408172 RepID=A0A383BHE2_9ZZZZ
MKSLTSTSMTESYCEFGDNHIPEQVREIDNFPGDLIAVCSLCGKEIHWRADGNGYWRAMDDH